MKPLTRNRIKYIINIADDLLTERENAMKKKKIWLVVLIISLVVFVIAAVCIVREFIAGKEPVDQYYLSETGSVSTSADNLPDNPIDFAKLHETNTDIYAWIKIPNTDVDYPILQSYLEHDNYYIDRDLNKNKARAGSIYTQKKNKTDFSDPNTLIYGHSMLNGTMFGTLKRFRKEEFFLENRYMYIYMPGHILTYEIFAAYLYDDRHILNAFDFTDKEVYKNYLDSCLNPKSMIKNIREGITLTTDDRIITLSTCYEEFAPTRYLVQGVLRNDERTK